MQPYQQFQMMSPQQQQLFLQQAQAGSIPSSGSPLDQVDPRRFRVLLARGLGKDGQSNTGSDLSQGVGSPLQVGSPVPRGNAQETEMLMKVGDFLSDLLSDTSECTVLFHCKVWQWVNPSALPNWLPIDETCCYTTSSAAATTTAPTRKPPAATTSYCSATAAG